MTTTSGLSQPIESKAAFDELKPIAEDLAPHLVRRPNVTVNRAVTTALGAYEKAQSLRKELLELAPHFDIFHLDQLKPQAMALHYAAVRSAAAGKPKPRLTASLVDEGKPLRERLLRTAEFLSTEGYFEPEVLAAIKGNRSHHDVASDLIQLGIMFNQIWDEVGDKLLFGPELIEQAMKKGDEIVEAVAEDMLGEEVVTLDLRDRFFSLMVGSYTELQRAVTFLRWEDDAHAEIVPNLTAASRRRRKKAASPAPEPAPAPAPEPPVA